MNIMFTRTDYAQIGVTKSGCLQIIHVDKIAKKSKKVKNLDKIVVAEQNGAILCMERKNGNTIVVFKTSPGPPINCIRMGGAIQTVQDKTFVASQTTVKGFSRKGKQFLSFETNMTEDISAMFVYGVDMLLCGRNSMYHFHDCVEKNSYFCSDQINDIICLPVIEGGWVGRGLTPVIACGDKTIKVIEGSRLVYEVKLNEIVNVLQLYQNGGGDNKQKVMYGTRNGSIGLVDLSPTEGKIYFELQTSTLSVVSAIKFGKLIEGNNLLDVVVGKEDGLIELYAVDEYDTLIFKQSYQCEESVISLECGCVSFEQEDEIIVSAYSGWIFSLSTHPPRRASGDLGSEKYLQDRSDMPPSMEIKAEQLKTEVQMLEERIKEERRLVKERDQQEPDASDLAEENKLTHQLSNIPPFKINDKFALCKDQACYLLSVELSVPIDYILLQSDVKVDLIDVERNSAVASLTHADPAFGNALLAAYRCQENVTRFEVHVRSIEGQFGTLRAYIVPRSIPISCQLCTYPIKPLALHERIHDFDAKERPLNTLTFTGAFSIAEAHSWLMLCVSQLPDRCPPSDSVMFNFQSTFNGGTVLRATYSKGKAVYISDNLSTIVILRDVISKTITMRQLKVHISCDMNERSVEHVLRLIHPKMEYQKNLRRKLELAKGIKELEATFQELPYLNDELKEALANYDQMNKEVAENSVLFDRNIGIITDLYIDKYKVKGKNVKYKANELLALLHDDYDLTKLIEFFNEKIQK